MDVDEIKEIGIKLKELADENKRLQDLRSRYVEHGKNLRTIIESTDNLKTMLKNLLSEIDPAVGISSMRGRKKTSLDSHREEFSNMLFAGTHITSALIESTYPDLAKSSVLKIMNSLKALPGVSRVKDGTKVRLFKTNG